MSVLDTILENITDQVLDTGDTVVLKPVCFKCKTEKTIIVKAKELRAYKNGALIQRAFPNMSADDREILTSGMCGGCFDQMFGCGNGI